MPEVIDIAAQTGLDVTDVHRAVVNLARAYWRPSLAECVRCTAGQSWRTPCRSHRQSSSDLSFEGSYLAVKNAAVSQLGRGWRLQASYGGPGYWVDALGDFYNRPRVGKDTVGIERPSPLPRVLMPALLQVWIGVGERERGWRIG
jgi:hypothetical protein